MRTPILFIVFNRPTVTQLVFDRIREAAPSRLYVAADGPRDGRSAENVLCNEVRKIATNIDWPCELKTLFRNTNLGCKLGVQTAIDWFFEREESGIILEDDCLPNIDFFRYASWALDTYRNEKSVWHINGNNFLAKKKLYQNNVISFTSLAQVWGWATWRDRWQHYQSDLTALSCEAKSSIKNWQISRIGKILKMYHLMKLKEGLDTWDYQWQITILNNRGLCISAESNMISNIGDGIDATHTRKDNRMRLETQGINSQFEYVRPFLNKKLTAWYEKKMGSFRLIRAVEYLIRSGIAKNGASV